MIQIVEKDKSHLKPLSKSEKKIIKSMKHNYRVARRVYASAYTNEEFMRPHTQTKPNDLKYI